LKSEIERLKKELAKLLEDYEKLKALHAKCPNIIFKLEEEIRILRLRIEELSRRKESSSSRESIRSRVDSEEKLEIVQVVKTKVDEMQFDVTTEKKT